MHQANAGAKALGGIQEPLFKVSSLVPPLYVFLSLFVSCLAVCFWVVWPWAESSFMSVDFFSYCLASPWERLARKL